MEKKIHSSLATKYGAKIKLNFDDYKEKIEWEKLIAKTFGEGKEMMNG